MVKRKRGRVYDSGSGLWHLKIPFALVGGAIFMGIGYAGGKVYNLYQAYQERKSKQNSKEKPSPLETAKEKPKDNYGLGSQV